jgi:hypothetical protein
MWRREFIACLSSAGIAWSGPFQRLAAKLLNASAEGKKMSVRTDRLSTTLP